MVEEGPGTDKDKAFVKMLPPYLLLELKDNVSSSNDVRNETTHVVYLTCTFFSSRSS